MSRDNWKENRQQFKGELKTQRAHLADDDLHEVAGDHYKFHGAVQERFADLKEEVARWAEIWCERGGWRNNPPAHRG